MVTLLIPSLLIEHVPMSHKTLPQHCIWVYQSEVWSRELVRRFNEGIIKGMRVVIGVDRIFFYSFITKKPFTRFSQSIQKTYQIMTRYIDRRYGLSRFRHRLETDSFFVSFVFFFHI